MLTNNTINCVPSIMNYIVTSHTISPSVSVTSTPDRIKHLHLNEMRVQNYEYSTETDLQLPHFTEYNSRGETFYFGPF